jgi:hypothetical protein
MSHGCRALLAASIVAHRANSRKFKAFNAFFKPHLIASVASELWARAGC